MIPRRSTGGNILRFKILRFKILRVKILRFKILRFTVNKAWTMTIKTGGVTMHPGDIVMSRLCDMVPIQLRIGMLFQVAGANTPLHDWAAGSVGNF